MSHNKPQPKAPKTRQPNFLTRVQGTWNTILTTIRSLLPENWNQKLSDTVLTGLIIGFAVILTWTASILSGTSPKAEQVPSTSLATPSELAAPTEPQPIAVIPEPTPTPTIELMPEQILIAGIQNQIAEITKNYPDGLIQSVEANFQDSCLTIKVGNDWYNFQQSQQDQLANKMLQQANELEFNQLSITDTEGKLLARSPVVGENMVILNRQKPMELQPA